MADLEESLKVYKCIDTLAEINPTNEFWNAHRFEFFFHFILQSVFFFQ